MARRFLYAATVAIAVCITLFTACLQSAYAKEYYCPQVDIKAAVKPDATLSVSELREFDFNGSFTCVWWELGDKLPTGATVVIESVKLSNSTAEAVSINEVPFQKSWRSEGGPGRDAWSFDSTYNTVYVFFSAEDESLAINLTYNVAFGVQVYKDVAELYWKFVGSSWGADSENVNLSLELPVLEGASVIPGDNVRAWAHGPLDGSVSISNNGVVNFDVARVPSGDFAEARVIFPPSWLTHFDASALDVALASEGHKNYRDYNKLPYILEEEQKWADEANAQRMWAYVIFFGSIALSLLGIISAFILWRKFGREYRSAFSAEYFRDAPDKDVTPAIISRLVNWNKENPKDFTATIMQLAHKGALRIDKGSYVGDKEKLTEGYFITRLFDLNDNAQGATLSDTESRALSILFDTISGNGTSLWFDDISVYAKDNPEDFNELMQSWQSALTVETDEQDYFELKGHILKGVISAFAFVYLIAGIGLSIFLENFVPTVCFCVTAVILFIFSGLMSRRTKHGAEVYAKTLALKKWLQHFSKLDERPPTDVKVWGEFMIYAYVLGVAKEAISELKNAVPEIFDEPKYVNGYPTYLPWYFWYSPTFSGTDFGVSLSDAFETTMSNTMQTVQTALSGASGSGGFSSGFGSGGGFSGGGGGGFGGGGGAR